MQASRSAQLICDKCSYQLFHLFRNGFSTTTKTSRPQREAWRRVLPRTVQSRSFINAKTQKNLNTQPAVEDGDGLFGTPAQMEAIVHQARQTFGETLPVNFLSDEEYKVYERLYGAPIDVARPEDIGLLQTDTAVSVDETSPERNVLLREDNEGNLEEIGYMQEKVAEPERVEDIKEADLDLDGDCREHHSANFKARVALFRDIAAANKAQSAESDRAGSNAAKDNYMEQYAIEESMIEEQEPAYEDDKYDDREAEDLEDREDDIASGDSIRTHPLTAAARSGTSPATLQIPKSAVVEPVMAILRDASNKHLNQVAQKTFGGMGLPNSTATPSTAGRHLQQAPIALEASQKYMGEMEGNVYLAAIMPGAYASVMSTLVEIRKRIGSEWLRNLLGKEGGPRILDAGAAGAGVQAWREVLEAEWKLMHPEGVPEDKPAPLGKATVVTGSNVLRHKASRLLQNTTFLPRLPDYNPERDHPTLGTPNSVQPRKQYDIIVAPHTLWGLREDYMRKTQVQNFWSLLNPEGGVLIIIEKGVPRGFELVAGARDMLLNRHIDSPGASAEAASFYADESSRGPKEKGMIIAPCTNHGRCPMYIMPGKSKGRKDLCHFSQRFIRPPYLQRILGAKDRNHEDIKFSYIAVQRGVDHRQTHDIIQGTQATTAALVGYENAGRVTENSQEQLQKASCEVRSPHMLSLPRTVLPPIKRRGHVILDLCTPSGRIERWTVPKSFSKQAYRDARKSRWGDLWALGAKTAITRNIRLGVKSKKAGGKSTYELNTSSDSAEDDMAYASGPNAKFEKRTKKGRLNPKQRKKIVEHDF